MNNIKEQFGEIIKTIRVKNKLSQEKLANELYLSSGKQIISYYEKGERIMKLPEFVEFTKKFNETVVISKDGIYLSDKTSNKNTEKEYKHMIKERRNLVLIEKKGDIEFYEEVNSKKQFQKIPEMALLPVVDTLDTGVHEYQLIESFQGISIKYDLAGVYGYSIWSGDRCLEDRFWYLEQVRESVKEMFFEGQKKKAISVMVSNIENKFEEEELELKECDFSSVSAFLNSLDDVLLDGGIFRCEGFIDIAIPYALNFGRIESEKFEEAQWECIEEAYRELKIESVKSVTCKPSRYYKDELEFEFYEKEDGSYKVILYRDGKKLIFREFYFGTSSPNLNTVLNAVKDDYQLLKSSPSLSAYIENRGMVEDISLDYDILRLDVKAMVDFFGKEFLESIID